MASSLEVNKVLAAILTAGIIASGSGVISRMIFRIPTPEAPAYKIPITEAAGGAQEAAKEPEQPIAVLLASASADKGQTIAKKCQACHNFEEGAGKKIGPDLHGVVGRKIASVGDFDYSSALKEKQGTWDYDKLNQWLTDPRKWAPGTKMNFVGLSKGSERADVILYLRSITDNPPPLPEAPAAQGAAPAGEQQAGEQQAGEQQAAQGQGEQQQAAKEQGPGGGAPAAAAGGGGGLEQLIAKADPAAGQQDAKKCAVCHNFKAGAGKKLGPDLHGVVGRKIASVEDFDYSSALKGKEGVWSYENLDQWLTDPRKWAPGTKMLFAGIKKPDERAEVIAYLRSITDNPPPLKGGG